MAMYSDVQRITEDPSVLSVVPTVSSQSLGLDMGGVASSFSHQVLEQQQQVAAQGPASGSSGSGGVVAGAASGGRMEPVEMKEAPLDGPPGEGCGQGVWSPGQGCGQGVSTSLGVWLVGGEGFCTECCLIRVWLLLPTSYDTARQSIGQFTLEQ